MSWPMWNFWGLCVCHHHILHGRSGTHHVPIKQVRTSLSEEASCFSLRVLVAVVAAGSYASSHVAS